jgi:recombination protein RecA
MQKKHGAESATLGGTQEEVERLPTGVFPFDLSTGGGFPRGKISIVYGPESSGKTNLFLLAIAQEQRKNPSQMNVFVDVENSFDEAWAKKLGVDTSKLIVLHPDYAEQAVDMVEAMLQAEDVSIIVVDSLAAMIPFNEMDSTAEKVSVGGNSAIIGKMMRKCINVMSKEKRKGHYPTVLMVNQTRFKIGVMFGNPETMPGGQAMKFASGLTIRIYGKNIMKESVSKTMPVFKGTDTVAQKWKVPIVSVNSTYNMCMIPHEGLKPGEVDDWNTVSTYMRDLGFLAKNGTNGWVMFEDKFKNLDECRLALKADSALENKIKSLIIEAMVAKTHGLAEEFVDADTEGEESLPDGDE